MPVWICGFNGFSQITALLDEGTSVVVNSPSLVKLKPVFNKSASVDHNSKVYEDEYEDSSNRQSSLCDSIVSTTSCCDSHAIIDVAIGWSKILVLHSNGRLYRPETSRVGESTACKSSVIHESYFESVGCGWTTVCAARRGGGDCFLWNLEDNHDKDSPPPERKVICETTATTIVSVRTNDSTVFAVTSDRHLLSVELCNDSAVPSLVFHPLLPVCVRTVSCGKHHVLVLSTIGVVFSHGKGGQGQLGHSSVESKSFPTIVEALEGVTVTSVAAGGWHSLAVTDAGDVYAWGWNERGQLGLPSVNVSGKKMTNDPTEENNCQLESEREQDQFVNVLTVPHLVDLPETYEDVSVVKVAGGSRHSVCLLESGVALTCGWNEYGQLGVGDCASRDALCAVTSFTLGNVRVADVFAGWWNTVFLTDRPS